MENKKTSSVLKLFCLIKFGRKEHLENLMNKGQMCFSSIKRFETSIEKERGDKYEGALNIINEQFSKIECDHPTIGKLSFTPLPNTLGTIIQFTDDPYFCFSSYALTSESLSEKDDHKISEKMIEFGEYALVISEPILFLNKVKSKLSDLNIEFEGRLVSYKDFGQKGDIGTTLFSKTNDLSHQFEHRILIKTDTQEEAVFIEIGSIKEYSFISRADEMIQTEFKAIRSQ